MVKKYNLFLFSFNKNIASEYIKQNFISTSLFSFVEIISPICVKSTISNKDEKLPLNQCYDLQNNK